MMWTAHEPLDRLATLVFRGARVERWDAHHRLYV